MSAGTLVEVTGPGHDLSRWSGLRSGAERLELIPLRDRLGVSEGAGLVVIAAHPDDETLGLGRLMHAWSRQVGSVTAIVATAGEACVDHVLPRPPGLADRRLVEWAAATQALGVDRRHALRLPDGSLSGVQDALVSTLEAVLDDPGLVHPELVLAAPWRGDPHPDHQAVGRAVEAVGRRRGLPTLEFGVWMTYWSEPEDLISDGRRLAVLTTDDADEQAHRLARSAFVSQLEPLAPGIGPVVPAAMLAHHYEQLLILPATEGSR